MSQEISELKTALVEFSQPTLLITGERRSFSWLARKMADREAVEFEPTLDPSSSKVSFVPTDGVGRFFGSGNSYVWQMSPFESVEVSDLLLNLIAFGQAGHAYLDPLVNETDIQIVASLGEYDLERMMKG